MNNQQLKTSAQSQIEHLTAALLLAGFCVAPGTIKGRPVQRVINTVITARRSA